MASTINRTNSGDVANVFIRCILSVISDFLGGFSDEDLFRTVSYFDFKCPYTGKSIGNDFVDKKYVLDHLIPHNRKSIGLNLYGNIIVTTGKVNTAKSAKDFETFIRNETEGSEKEKEERINKIKQFQKDSGYFEKIKNIDEIKKFCEKEYDFIKKRLKNHVIDYKRMLEI